MSIQTTIKLSRAEAEKKWVEQRLERERKNLATYAQILTDQDIEDEIEEHFYNYRIVDQPLINERR